MKKLDKKKLQLGSETIRALSSDTLVQAHGGGLQTVFLCSVRTQRIGCDLPSMTCSIVGYENTCGSGGVIG